MRLAAELDHWEGEPVGHWQSVWQVPELHILEITGSTNDDARALAEHGSPSGTVVIAERQSAGRGQKGRAWYGTAGRSLHLSLLLRADSGVPSDLRSSNSDPRSPIPDPVKCLSAAPVRVGLLAARALSSALELPIGLKWPNDVQFEGRKIGGILCESVLDPHLLLIVGIGINVTQQEDDFPAELRPTATSLAAATNRVMQRAIVAGALTRVLATAGSVIAQPLSGTELTELAAIDVLRGHAIDVDGREAGIARGITAEGCLRVEQQHGITELHTGTVRLTKLS